jgi:hypothetical protein
VVYGGGEGIKKVDVNWDQAGYINTPGICFEKDTIDIWRG